MAINQLVQNDVTLLKLEMASGVYNKDIKQAAKELKYEPLPEEIRVAVIASWKRAGVLPSYVVQEIIPKQITENATTGN
jgi:hypothetical protein